MGKQQSRSRGSDISEGEGLRLGFASRIDGFISLHTVAAFEGLDQMFDLAFGIAELSLQLTP